LIGENHLYSTAPGRIPAVQKLNDLSVFATVVELLENEHVAPPDAGLGGGSGGQFERGYGTASARNPPWFELVHDPDHGALAIEEDDVDGEAHEKHVHRGSSVDEHPGTGFESSAAEQPPRSRE
jgi:hypothetical protein